MPSNKKNAPGVGGATQGAEEKPSERKDHPQVHHSISRQDRQARMADAFRRCREEVSAEDVARRYGLEIDAHGKALCVFHRDHRPSMSFHSGRFRCFSCGAAGSSIDLAAQILNMTPAEAVKRLNDDFSLGLELGRPMNREERAAADYRQELSETSDAFERWRETMLRDLNHAFRIGHTALKAGRDLTDREALAVRFMAELEYWCNLLESKELSEQISVFHDRAEVKRICDQVLNNMPMKSGAA